MMRSKRALGALVIAVVMTAPMAVADLASTTWTGTNSSAWSDPGNWTAGIPGSHDSSTRDLFFGSGPTSSNNDLSTYDGHYIAFQSDAGPFTISGNAFSLFDYGPGEAGKPKIENFSSSTQTFSITAPSGSRVGIALAGGGTGAVQIDPANGDLVFNNAVSVASPLDVFGNQSTNHVLTFNGSLAIGGNALTIKDTSTVRFTADQTGSGTIFINAAAGRLEIGNGGSTGSVASSAISNNGTISINRAGSLTLASQVTGSGSLQHIGGGTTSLTNAGNNYSGGTVVSAGTLRANNGSTGSATGSGAVTVGSGATLGGNGRIGNGSNAVTIATGATITAGASATSVGTLQAGAVVFQPSTSSQLTSYAWKLGDATANTAGSGWDTLVMNTLDLSQVGTTDDAKIQVTALSSGMNGAITNFDPTVHHSFLIATIQSGNFPSDIADRFKLNVDDIVAKNTGLNSNAFHLAFASAGDNSGGTITIEAEASPEPTTALLFGAGGVGLFASRRRRLAIL